MRAAYFYLFLHVMGALLPLIELSVAIRPSATQPSFIATLHRYNYHRLPLLLFAKDGGNKYGSDERKSQRELLLDLETKLGYEGRISSKIASIQEDQITNNNDDEVTEKKKTEMPSSSSSSHRCALLTILGNPNAGKSTLLNGLLSENLAIATSRPQTTRHAILGVLTADNTQLCITDTPGIIENPAYKLQVGMMDAVKGAVRDADVFLVVVDVAAGGIGGDGGEADRRKSNNDGDGKKNNSKEYDGEMNERIEVMEEDEGSSLGIDEEMLEKLRRYEKPVIVCVNKIDLVASAAANTGKDGKHSAAYTNTPTQAVQAVQRWRTALPNAFAIIPTCAANGPDDPGVVALRSILLANEPSSDVGSAIRGLGRPIPGMFATTNMIGNNDAREILPIGPPLYHPDFFTDRTDRFCASEIIRETLFERLGKELPYCCEVRIETFDESRRYLDDADEYDMKGGQRKNDTAKRKAMIRIGATILVERDSQKGIVVGKGGRMIKDVGMVSRKKLQEFFGVKVFLDLRVKVDKNWRNSDDKLKKFGYT